MKPKVHKKTLSDFYKNIFIMFRGTVIAQVFALLGSIILAKMYGETAYGFFGVFISISSIVSVINTLQLEHCIITSKKESKNWYNTILTFTPIISFLLFLIISPFTELNSKLNYFILISSFTAGILISFFTVNENFYVSNNKFNTISNLKITLAFLTIFFQLIFFYFFELRGLIFGTIASYTLIVLFYLFNNKKNIQKPNLKQLKKEIKSNYSLLTFLLPSNIINSLGLNIMPVLLLTFFSTEQAGVYFLSLKILSAPLMLLSNSVSKVYFQKASELFETKSEELFFLTKKIVLTNFWIMLILLILINSLGIYLLELFFDKNWRSLRLYTLILSFLILARSLFNPISSIIVVKNKNHISLLFNIYLLIINLLAFFIGKITNNIINTIIVLSIFGGVGYLALLFYFSKELKIKK